MPAYAKTNTAKASDSYQFDDMREKWADRLVGNNVDNPSEELNIYFSKREADAKDYWLNLKTGSTDGSGKDVWQDLNLKNQSEQYTIAYDRLRTMALAYQTPECTDTYQNPDLYNAICTGLTRMNQYYDVGKDPFGNWWPFDIGAPQALNDVLVLLYDELNQTAEGKALLDYQIAATQYYVPNPLIGAGSSAPSPMTGADLADTSIICAIRGVLANDEKEINAARKAVITILDFKTSGDGFYQDGSFIQHSFIPYTGGYGQPLISSFENVAFLLDGTDFDLKYEPLFANIISWMRAAYLPLFHNGEIMDMVRGKDISREFESAHDAGYKIMATLLLLADYTPASIRRQVREEIKGNLERDTICDNSRIDNLKIYEYNAIKDVLDDLNTEAKARESSYKNYGSMDRVVAHREDYSIGISMFSERIGKFSFGNGENKKGYHTSDGMLYLYTDDSDQFVDQYWSTVDYMRLPGITTDHTTATVKAWYDNRNDRAWVGGSEVLGLYGSAGMDLKLKDKQGDGSTLTGKKSWFTFDDEIICLGADLSSSSGDSLETIVENRKIDGDNQVISDGKQLNLPFGMPSSITGSWIVLEGNDTGNGTSIPIGYYFPESNNVNVSKETRSGTWNEVNDNGSSSTISRFYFKIAIPHGNTPVDGASYSYVLLPGKDASEVESYAEDSGLTILQNDNEIQAVRDEHSGLSGYNFWKSGSVDGIEVNGPCSVTKYEEDTETEKSITLGISCPPRSRNNVTITLDGEYQPAAGTDTEMTITYGDGKTRMIVNLAKASGNSRKAVLKRQMSHITVINGEILSIDGKESGERITQTKPGAVIEIKADEHDDETFVTWQTVPASIKLASPSDATTTFKAPAGFVRAEAIYRNTASPSNATATSSADPVNWYAYADRDSLNELLDDEELVTAEDQEKLRKGWNVNLLVTLKRLDPRYQNSKASAIKAELEDEEKIGFFVNPSLKKTITNPKGNKTEQIKLASASNAIQVTMEVPLEYIGKEHIRIIGCTGDEEPFISEYTFVEEEEGRLITLDGEVNGLFAYVYQEPEDPDPNIPGDDDDDHYDKYYDDDDSGHGPGHLIWEQDHKGWRFKEYGRFVTSGWRKLSWQGVTKWYYFGPDGYMKTGWQNILWNGEMRWFYLGTDGGMHTGWLKDPQDGMWYYLIPETGVMTLGERLINDTLYYFNDAIPEMPGESDLPLGALLTENR